MLALAKVAFASCPFEVQQQTLFVVCCLPASVELGVICFCSSFIGHILQLRIVEPVSILESPPMRVVGFVGYVSWQHL